MYYVPSDTRSAAPRHTVGETANYLDANIFLTDSGVHGAQEFTRALDPLCWYV
jgi:hypothetical protein